MCILWRVRIRIAVIVLAAAAGASCRTAAVADARPPIVQPGLPGQPSHLIGHHAQAVEMVALVPSRTSSEDVKRLALRIDVSQKDEMNMMREWLQARGQQLPDPRAHHMMGATLMPGMLTAEEMEQLAAATGAAFDRLFLAGMIKHHGGAIEMVHDL